MLLNLARVLGHKILRRKTDFFLSYKYEIIKEHYGKHCLDIGTGTGRFATYLNRQGKEVETIDIVNKIESDLPFELFNGYDIPLKPKSTDTSLLFFVLHHTDYQEELLRECSRVSRKTIIVGEDIIGNKFDRIMGNIHLGTSPWSKGRTGFKTDQEWLKLFEKLNLLVLDSTTIQREVYPVYPVLRKIYVLQPN